MHGFFISSDNPVVRWVHPKTAHPIYGDHGFFNKTAEVTFPLAPNASLLMTWNEDAPKHLAITRKNVEFMNTLRAFFADEFLYAHVNKKALRRLATHNKDSRPRMTTEGFGPKEFANIEIPRRWKS
jgi:hypothetical protein